jgi:hypothetical protein
MPLRRNRGYQQPNSTGRLSSPDRTSSDIDGKNVTKIQPIEMGWADSAGNRVNGIVLTGWFLRYRAVVVDVPDAVLEHRDLGRLL